MSNPIILWIAGILGWDPGIIVMLITLVVLFSSMIVIVFLIEVLPQLLQRAYRKSSGAKAFILGTLLAIAVTLAFVLNIFVLIGAVISVAYLATEGRDWWHRGRR